MRGLPAILAWSLLAIRVVLLETGRSDRKTGLEPAKGTFARRRHLNNRVQIIRLAV